MLKLGYTFSLGVSLGFAKIHAFVQQNDPALIELADALRWFDRLTQIGVQLDPQHEIRPRLQEMVDTNTPRQNVILDSENQLAQAYTTLNIPVLLDTYQLGGTIGAAETLTTTNHNSWLLSIQLDATSAANLADNLSNDTPIQVPLNLSDIPGSLRTIASQTDNAAFADLHNSLLFVRGKCQGILDVTGENF